MVQYRNSLITDYYLDDNIGQLLLFMDEHVLLNSALQDLQALRPEAAIASWEKYRETYPRGVSVEKKLRLAGFLQEGLLNLPSGDEGATALFRLAHALTGFAEKITFAEFDLLEAIRLALFRQAAQSMEKIDTAQSPFLLEGVSRGYIYLLARLANQAVFSLQIALRRMPQDARLYGYLGDAYGLRGDREAARGCYQEALTLNPAGVDWSLCQDKPLLDARRRLQEEFAPTESLADNWLAARAYILEIFRPRKLRDAEALKKLTDDYLAIARQYKQAPQAVAGARLFFLAICLCDNEIYLRGRKDVDIGDMRKVMKTVSPEYFADYMSLLKNRDERKKK